MGYAPWPGCFQTFSRFIFQGDAMKLRTQVMALGVAGALTAALVGAIGLNAARVLGTTIHEVMDAGSALQLSQDADMMHDAMRADAQAAILAAMEGHPDEIAAAAKDLQEHSERFEKALKALSAQVLEGPSRQALAAAEPVYQRYAQSARATVLAASQGPEAMKQARSAMGQAFEELETRMEDLSSGIQATAKARSQNSDRHLHNAMLMVALVLAAASVGLLALARWFSGHISRPIAHAVEVADGMARGDLTTAVRAHGNEEAQRLLQALSEMQSKLGAIVRDVKTNAERVASASLQIAQGNQDLSARTEQQAQALQQTSSTMVELGGNVRANTESAKKASELAQGASQVATLGGEMMSQVVSNMSGINESSRKIADIISVIDGIAFQTNILALNAAVEAARAGEQGRGFAVVAGEVRNLAGRSAEAAREIKTLISASVERVEQGSSLVERAGQTMDEIVNSIQQVTSLATQISSASVEQTSGVDDVGRAVAQMDSSTQQNAAMVEQSAAAASSLSQQAQMLVKAVSAFRIDADWQGAKGQA